jgi:uncharacterized membrane protein
VRAAIYALAAVLVAMVTPLVRHSPVIDSLPIWIQWYLRPAGEYTTFTFFPWVGFVAAGAASGSLLVLGTADRRQESRSQLAFFAVGALLIASGFAAAARPSLYPDASFWTTSPTWFAIRVGVMMAALAVFYGLAEIGLVCRPLERFGRHSLFVYWIHVELVYGYASWLWRGRLPLWGTAIGLVAFCFLMYRAIDLRDAVVRTWQQRPKGGRATAPATA